MGVRNTKTNEKDGKKAVSKRSTVAASAAETPVKATQAELKETADRDKVLKSFHPAVKDFFRENLGMDLGKTDVKTLYELLQGKLTSSVQELTVTPLVYDRDLKENVEMSRIKVFSSVRAIFPFKDGKMVAPDADNRIFIATVPCRPMLEKAEGAEIVPEAKAAPARTGEDPVFTEGQMKVLEGVGINRERLFGGFNHLDRETKSDILAGRVFPVDGAVKTSFGFVNVIGEAQMRTDKNGAAYAVFSPAPSEPRDADKVIDILAARRIGTLELDIFRRDSNGKVISDVNGVPMLNQAGANLVRYGYAMEPVAGYNHHREYDAKQKKFVDRIERRFYQVTAVNGNLFATAMAEVPELNPDGTKVTYKDKSGKEVVRTHPEAQVRVKDGKVFVDGKSKAPLEFASERDLQDFLRGKGGVVKGAVYHDFKANKDVTYDAFVVPDNTRAGFAKQFTPETSKKLIERRDQGVKTVRKQNFGIGF